MEPLEPLEHWKPDCFWPMLADVNDEAMARKLRLPPAGQPIPPLTQLKLLPEADHERIREWLEKLSGQDANAKVAAEFGIQCARNTLYLFRAFLAQQDREAAHAESLARLREFYVRTQPEQSREQLREAGLSLLLEEALVAKDWRAFERLANLDRLVQANFNEAARDADRLTLAARELTLKEQKAAAAGKFRPAAAAPVSAASASSVGGPAVPAPPDPKMDALLDVS